MSFITAVRQCGLVESVIFDPLLNRSKCGQVLQALVNFTAAHQLGLIVSDLFGPPSNPGKSGHLQAITNFREQ